MSVKAEPAAAGSSVDAIVVGGGLGGLAAATYLAKAGLEVTLLEKSRNLGGRAATEVLDRFFFNLGPHALYVEGQASQVLTELGIPFTGGKPPPWRYGVKLGRKVPMRGNLNSAIAARPSELNHLSIAEWLASVEPDPDSRDLTLAAFRVVTEVNAPTLQSAGAAIAQLHLGYRGVLYLDGGWQTLVNGLRAAAESAGVKLLLGSRAARVESSPNRPPCALGVRLADGTFLRSSHVILAASPREAIAMEENLADLESLAQLTPSRVACLDLALSRLPDPEVLYALGLDVPLYFSVHSAGASLAPEGGIMAHAAKFIDPLLQSNPEADKYELEAFVDLLQPGWRDLVLHRRFLPRLASTNAIVRPTTFACSRPHSDAGGIQHLHFVGDWVGNDGMLADASLATARQVAETIAGEMKTP